MTDILYRGVNEALHQSTGGRLLPKACGDRFERQDHYGEEVYYGDGSVYGKSERNAVIMHQRDSTTYPTSGVSTTPNFQHAVLYATHRGQSGYVYKIDVALLEAYGVRAFSVDHGFAQKLAALEAQNVIAAKEKELLLIMTDAGSAASHRGWKPEPEQLDTILAATEGLLQRVALLGPAAKKIKDEIPPRPERPKK